MSAGTKLRTLLKAGTFLHLPSVYDALTGLLVEQAGFEAAFVGGYVSGAATGITEPRMTMTEQADITAAVTRAIGIPTIVDAATGWGEPMHIMRTIHELVRAGAAGAHLEDQLFPKRAHYHKYQVHVVPTDEYVQRIRFACRARDEVDPDFVVISRTDTCREFGLTESADRINRTADVGADMGLLFPRTPQETEQAPRMCRLPLVYVMSRGNRDGRPIFTRQDLQDMGYVACIEAQVVLSTAFAAVRDMLRELRSTGTFSGLSEAELVTVRKEIEDLIGLERYYALESDTVETASRTGK